MKNKEPTKVTAYTIYKDGFDDIIIGMWLLLNDNRLIEIRINSDSIYGRAEIDNYIISDRLLKGDSIEDICKCYKLTII